MAWETKLKSGEGAHRTGSLSTSEAICEDVRSRLADDPGIDSSGIEVRVEGCRVILEGTVTSELAKQMEEGLSDFDVVIASEVLEHVLDPHAMLVEILRVLRPGGLLWATTPHGRGISARLLGLEWSNVCPPEHLQLFSVAGICRRQAGSR